ncbi:MAG: aminotransferase class IV family protein [Deltaproteobacteria bacterium]|nr:aminotransferase class IV family protein [Deltaproteobacteria bacterium]
MSEAEATVHVTARGYLLGEGVFATMRGYEGVCFRSREHLATLARGAALFGLELPVDQAALADLADEAATRCGATNAYVRVTLAGGGSGDAVLSILARALDAPSPSAYANGIDVATVSLRRAPPECGDPSVKTTSYGREVLMRREALAKGVDDGVVLAVDGSVACATMANLFVVRGDELLTPEPSTGCRAGVTRGALLELARGAGLVARETRISPSALLEAEEVFLANTRVECLPVARIDGRPTRGRFERTRALHALLRDAIRTDTAARRRRDAR